MFCTSNVPIDITIKMLYALYFYAHHIWTYLANYRVSQKKVRVPFRWFYCLIFLKLSNQGLGWNPYCISCWKLFKIVQIWSKLTKILQKQISWRILKISHFENFKESENSENITSRKSNSFLGHFFFHKNISL